jgi:pimeloyl-ACP methyl ester carboxylesterase
MPAAFRQPVRSAVPTLLISGYADPATPLENAEAAARHLPNSRHVVVRYGSHSFTGMRGCIDKIMVGFLRALAPRTLDSSCAAGIRRPAWAAKRSAPIGAGQIGSIPK